MDWEPFEREAFFALLHRLEQRPVDLLLIEIAREIEKAKRSRNEEFNSSDRNKLLEEIRGEIIEVLGRILQEGKSNAFLRAEAVEILGSFQTAAPVAVRALIGALADEVSFVCVAACQALGRMGAAARMAVKRLRQTAAHQDPDVRRAAMAALQQIEA